MPNTITINQRTSHVEMISSFQLFTLGLGLTGICFASFGQRQVNRVNRTTARSLTPAKATFTNHMVFTYNGPLNDLTTTSIGVTYGDRSVDSLPWHTAIVVLSGPYPTPDRKFPPSSSSAGRKLYSRSTLKRDACRNRSLIDPFT